ncbi:YqaJ viral recombinase family protein [Pseudomonas eucalypticola]|uniref:YqaJ viral recombinase family protein n=1 Tax=Pseudomonas eucalypticola TaxID=2599595 RepID=A0A7D5H7A9_9PSED|nr:YqaJ viral recombinase family protein [Pseudomonas eucalypticola]QKZ05863.1 YqaJ viral recombinase family protein [Pseudomonas eucalypticola]
MKIHHVTQGSAEWHALRAKYNTASEAPAMMGASKYQSRTELLNAKKTGIVPEVTAQLQRIFDRGHVTEAQARPLAEDLVGEDLFPIVATEGNLLASMDGATMLGDTLFEHKLWNESLVAQVRAGELEPHYYWQLEQQLLVGAAERVIFVCSDGTPENFVHMEYRAVPGRAEQLIEGWKQFEQDLANHQVVEVVAEVVGTAPESLPALRIEVTGMVTASNLEQFKAHSLAVIGAINTDLQTDQHFADADKTVKWCGEAESRLAAAKQHALSQTESIDLLFRTIDQISEQVRAKRLELEKLVKARKVAIRDEIVITAAKALHEHVEKINASFAGRVRMPAVPADFAGVIKGKKGIKGLRDAADTELARAKIEASQIGDSIRANLQSLDTLAKDHLFLFNDLQQLVMKANDDLVALIKVRIDEHQKAEEERLEKQREAIRQEEAAKLAAAAAKPAPAPAAVAEPVKPSAAPVRQVAPSAKVAPKPTKLEARVTDLEALVQAVAAGQVPIAVLTVNWGALDAIVEAKGTEFSMPGVTLEQVAA